MEKNEYGLPRMTVEEEMNLPEPKRATMQNKIAMVDRCNSMELLVERIRHRAQRIPLHDDPCHAELVSEMAALVSKAEKMLLNAAMYGWN